jgi:hypothetical protein
MGVSICRDAPLLLTRQTPNRWRYLLHAHAGPIDRERAGDVSRRFDGSPALEVIRSDRPHVHGEIVRQR